MFTEQHEIEGEVISLYRAGSVDPERYPGAIRLARALAHKVEFVPQLPMRASVEYGSPIRIEIRREMTPAGREYGCGHELGHIITDRCSCGDSRIERVCDRIAVSIVAPRPAMFKCRMVYGVTRIPQIASALGTSETIVVLRWGDVFEESTAVDVGRGIRRSGPGRLPDDKTLRQIVRAGGGDGIRVVNLTRGWMAIANV